MKKKGIALVVIIFFGFCIAIVMFAMVNANSNLKFQNVSAINDLQLQYLNTSAVQFAKFYVKSLPVKSKSGVTLLDSTVSPGLEMVLNKYKPDFSLVNQSISNNDFPYGGQFKLTVDPMDDPESFQISYTVNVESTIKYKKTEKKDKYEERFSISRTSGDFYHATAQ